MKAIQINGKNKTSLLHIPAKSRDNPQPQKPTADATSWIREALADIILRAEGRQVDDAMCELSHVWELVRRTPGIEDELRGLRAAVVLDAWLTKLEHTSAAVWRGECPCGNWGFAVAVRAVQEEPVEIGLPAIAALTATPATKPVVRAAAAVHAMLTELRAMLDAK